MHRRRRQVEPLRDLAEAQPVVALEHGEDAQRAVDRLDHRSPPPIGASRLGPVAIRGLVRRRNTSVTSEHHSTLSNDIREYTVAVWHPQGDRDRLRRAHERTVHRSRSSPPRSSGPRSWCSSASARSPPRSSSTATRPFTMADLGMISLAFGTIVVATVYALGPHRRQPHQPGGHPRPGRDRQVPVEPGPGYIARPGASARSSARPRSSACSAQKASDVGLGVAAYADTVGVGAGLRRRVRRHLHPRVHRSSA